MDNQHTILLVDDAPMFLEIESLFLARSGRIVTATSGEEALAVAQREHPILMVVDAYMPGMDGAALCRAVRADPELGDTRVVILTSSDAAEDRAEAIRAGADDVLGKPISRVELIETVTRFVRYASVRGLPRVPFRGRVRVDDGHTDWTGHARNLSRGGIFVEGPKELGLQSEVTLEFDLPEGRVGIRPTAEVVWLERESHGETLGMGFRFIGLDGVSSRLIDSWVHERTCLPGARGMM
jgi:uncharacterized protein (TIGR02266 family)